MPIIPRHYILLAALALAAAPANAAISLIQGSLGTTSETIDVDDYSICDNNEDYCQTLPYGGRYQEGGWRLTLTNNSVDFRFGIGQRSDEGGPLYYDAEASGRFSADTPVRVFVRQSAAVRRFGPLPCSDCVFDPGSGYQIFDPGGGGLVQVTFGLAPVAYLSSGEQRADSRFVLKIAEVPEPATWAMLITGFAFIGTAARRKARVHG